MATHVRYLGVVFVVDGAGGEDAGGEDAQRELDLDGGVVSALERLCSLTSDRLVLLGATVTVMSSQAAHVIAASSSPARALEQAQFALGEGPGCDAFATRRVVIADLHDHGGYAWTAFTPAALDEGVVGIGAFPLQIGAALVGVLTIYSTGVCTTEQVSAALGFAEIATDLLIGGTLETDTADLADDVHASLDTALDTHAHIYQAQGMVMVDLQISLLDALSRMRAHAWATGEDLTVLAAEIVAGRTRLPRDPAPPTTHTDHP